MLHSTKGFLAWKEVVQSLPVILIGAMLLQFLLCTHVMCDLLHNVVSLAGNLYGLEKFWAFLKYYKVSFFFSLVLFCILVWVFLTLWPSYQFILLNVAACLCMEKVCIVIFQCDQLLNNVNVIFREKQDLKLIQSFKSAQTSTRRQTISGTM